MILLFVLLGGPPVLKVNALYGGQRPLLVPEQPPFPHTTLSPAPSSLIGHLSALSGRGAAGRISHWLSAVLDRWESSVSLAALHCQSRGTPRPPGCPSLVPPCLLHSVLGSEADGAPADGRCCCTIETAPRPASLRGQQLQEEVDPALVTILKLQWRTEGVSSHTRIPGAFSPEPLKRLPPGPYV